MAMSSNLGVKLFENRPHNVLSEAKVDAYTTRFFLACMEKLDLLTGKSDYTQEEWFDILAPPSCSEPSSQETQNMEGQLSPRVLLWILAQKSRLSWRV